MNNGERERRMPVTTWLHIHPVVARLTAALVCGMLVGWLLVLIIALLLRTINYNTAPVYSSHLETSLWAVIYLFPLSVGILTPWTVRRRQTARLTIAVGTGLMILGGAAISWVPLAVQVNVFQRRLDAQGFYNALETARLALYLLSSAVLVVFGSVMMTLAIKGIKKMANPGSE